MLKELSRQTFEAFDHALERNTMRLSTAEVGTVARVTSGAAEVRGFTDIAANELLLFADGTTGIAANLEIGRLDAILLGHESGLHVGDDVRRTHRVVDTPVGDALLGSRCGCSWTSPRQQRSDKACVSATRRASGAGHHRSSAGERTSPYRNQGYRCCNPRRPRTARTDHRRPVRPGRRRWRLTP